MGEDVIKPMLRFPEFNENWHKTILENVFKIFNGYAFSSKDNADCGLIWVKIADVGIQQMKKDNLSFLPISFRSTHSKFLLNKGDVVVALTRPILNGQLKIAKIDNFFHESILNQRVGKIETSNNLDFIYFYLQRDILIKEIENNISGTDPPNLSPNDINSIEVTIPKVIEQTKIASFLTAVDDKLQALKKKKELLEQYKKGMMQQLFSQEIRFKKDDGTNYHDWEWKKLSEVSVEHLTKNTRNDVTEVFSVSKHKGVINQIEHLGRSFSSKEISNYKVIFQGDLVYTKSPTSEFPFGIIKQNRTERVGVVSPLYCVFKPVTIELGYILHEYFYSHVNTFNYLNPLVQKGAKNTMNINNETFLNGAELFLPIDNEEQTKIANFLSAIDDKIAHCQSELDGLVQWKKGLLQQMFC
jgi:type I restriction enzyme S subunit